MDIDALIGKGRMADVYAWGDGRILKLYQVGMPVPGVEREFTITRAAQVAGLPVPATYELVEVEGRPGIVFERYLQICPVSRTQIDQWRLPLLAARLREVNDYPQEQQILLRQLKAVIKSESH